MWVMVFFDLPTKTKKDRRVYSMFRKSLIKDGFSMFQYSIYIRHCASRENTLVHVNRVKSFMPNKGKVVVMTITDKQFGEIKIFVGKNLEQRSLDEGYQLELF